MKSGAAQRAGGGGSGAERCANVTGGDTKTLRRENVKTPEKDEAAMGDGKGNTGGLTSYIPTGSNGLSKRSMETGFSPTIERTSVG